MSRLTLLALWLLCQLAHAVASLWMLISIIVGSPRALQIAIGYDQVANAATGGTVDQTISRRAARGAREGMPQWCMLCKLLDLVALDHCKNNDVPGD